MTTPFNTLDEFQSHSIHYVMLVARTTEELRQFADASDQGQSAALLAVENCKQLGQEVKLPGQQGAGTFLVMDTRRFSQFTINHFEINTKPLSLESGGSFHGFSSSMSFTIVDSQGISFANFLQYLQLQKLQTSQIGMCFILKIIFVGHKTDGSSKVIHTNGIPFQFRSIELDLNEAKGLYACKCICISSMESAGMTDDWTRIGTATTYYTGVGGNTLGAVVQSFENRLNEESLKRYAQRNAKTPELGPNDQPNERYGRPVQYMISLPKGWADFKFSGPAQGGATEINFKELLQTESAKKSQTAESQQKKSQTNTTAKAKDSHLSVDPKLSITQVLDIIFHQTTEVALLGNFTKPQAQTSEIKFYKHIVSFTSNDENFTVHVDIVEYLVPNIVLAAKSSAVSNSESPSPYVQVKGEGGTLINVPRNFLEYDYIFSGKNLDVLHLDLKFTRINEILLGKTQTGSNAIQMKADSGQKQTDGEAAASDSSVTQGMLRKDPVLMPIITGDQSTNFSNLGPSDAGGPTPQEIAQQYTRNITNMIISGPLESKMTVRGNPEFLDKFPAPSLLTHVVPSTLGTAGGASSAPSPGAKEAYRKELEKALGLTGFEVTAAGTAKVNLTGAHQATTPVYIKVNVFGPNVDFITNEQIVGGDFSTRLFYDQYYLVTKIISKIEGTKFTHEFTLTAYSPYGTYTSTAQGQNAPATAEAKE